MAAGVGRPAIPDLMSAVNGQRDEPGGGRLPIPEAQAGACADQGSGGNKKIKRGGVGGGGEGGGGAGGWGQCGGGNIPKLDLRIPNFVGAGIDHP